MSIKAQVLDPNKNPFYNYDMRKGMKEIYYAERDSSFLKASSSFILYSFRKLWREDPCGHKGYRRNIYDYMYSYFMRGNLKKDDIVTIFGKRPYTTTETSKIQTYIYAVEFDESCEELKQYLLIRFEKPSFNYHSHEFHSGIDSETEW